MTVSLQKGGKVSLSKEAPGLNALTVGLGWDVRQTDGAAFDLDASVFMLGENGQVIDDKHFIFYGQLKSPDGAVVHTGDNLTGEGDGDDEQVNINLATLPANVSKLVFGVTIHEAEQRGQNFGQVSNAFIRVVNSGDGSELSRYDLSEDSSMETAMVFGEVYRHGAEWKFGAVGQGYAGGLAALCKTYGVNV